MNPKPLTDTYLAEAEQRARRFAGAFTGTSGTLAADVLYLLLEVERLKVELALLAIQHGSEIGLSPIRREERPYHVHEPGRRL